MKKYNLMKLCKASPQGEALQGFIKPFDYLATGGTELVSANFKFSTFKVYRLKSNVYYQPSP